MRWKKLSDAAAAKSPAAEDSVAMAVVRSIVGLIPRSAIAVTVKVDTERVILRYWVDDPTDETVQEDLEEAVDEVKAALPDGPVVEGVCVQGAPPAGWHEWAGTMVYRINDREYPQQVSDSQ